MVKYRIVEDKFKNEIGKPIVIYSIQKKQKGLVGLFRGWSNVSNPSLNSIVIFYHKFDAKRFIVSIDKKK